MTSSDSGSFDTDGANASKWSCVISDALATAALVCSEFDDKAEVSDSGVDDPTIKLPLTEESTVCA